MAGARWMGSARTVEPGRTQASIQELEGRGAPKGGRYGIVAVAASAGGVQALSRVLCELPSNSPVPVVVVQHLDPHHRS